MSTNASEYYQNNLSAMKPVREGMPDLIKGFGGLRQSAVNTGSLDTMTKELRFNVFLRAQVLVGVSQ